jgi:hypothetical protein
MDIKELRAENKRLKAQLEKARKLAAKWRRTWGDFHTLPTRDEVPKFTTAALALAQAVEAKEAG